MAWDGNGTYTRTNGTNTGSTTWAQDAAAGTKILSTRHDTHDEDIATAINACVTQNNESKPTADFAPNVTGTYDIGTSSLKWEDMHINGKAYFYATDDADLDAVSGSLIIGSDGTTQHVAIDANEIMSKSDATTAGTLSLQASGGILDVGQLTAVSAFNITATTMSLNGDSISVNDTKYKTADLSRNSTTTLADDNHLAGWSLAAASYYKVTAFLYVTTTTGEFKWKFTTDNAFQEDISSFFNYSSTATATTLSPNVAAITAERKSTLALAQFVMLHGFIKTHASLACAVDFQWSQDVSDASATIVKEGSWITFEKMG